MAWRKAMTGLGKAAYLCQRYQELLGFSATGTSSSLGLLCGHEACHPATCNKDLSTSGLQVLPGAASQEMQSAQSSLMFHDGSTSGARSSQTRHFVCSSSIHLPCAGTLAVGAGFARVPALQTQVPGLLSSSLRHFIPTGLPQGSKCPRAEGISLS